MKKIKFLTFLLAAIALTGTGCLKDKGYDNQQYGINDADASPAGVGFTLGVKFFNNTGLTLSDQPQLIDSAVVTISLLSGKPAATDVVVKVQVDPALLADYNTANGTSIIQLDPALYSISTVDVVIPAGKTKGIININVPNTTTLDPNETYGLGFRIVSVDGGYIIASNEKTVLLSIAIKNIYDGNYTSNGYVYHPSAPRPIIDRAKTLSTVNATTVDCELGDLGAANYHAYFDVDPITNLVTISPAAGAAGGTYYQFDAGFPTIAPGPLYTAQWARSAECNNTYDPITEEFKVRYGYIGGTGFRITEEVIKRN